MTSDTHNPDDPVTIIVSRLVKRGFEAQFEEWAKGVTHDALAFPGHLGANIIRPADHSHPEYVIIFRFDSYTHLKAWEESDLRRTWLEKSQPLIVGEPKIARETGLEYWFDVPMSMMPPRYKQAMISWLAIFPLSYLASILLNLVIMPPLVRIMIQAAIVIALMTYIVMPRMTKIFAFWLFKR
jgi:uncharacterized protein